MKNQKIILLLLFSTFIAWYSNGQTYLTEACHYNMEDGLSHSQVLSTYKDTKGMMWVLAKDKLNRFDGKDFEGINHSRTFNPAARIIGEDQTGDLWIKNAYEKYDPLFFNLNDESFKDFTQKFRDTPLENYKGIEFYFIGNSGHYFFGTTSSELVRYDPINQKIQTISFDKETRVLPFYEDGEGVIWINNISYTSREKYRGSSQVMGIDISGKVIHQFHINQIVFNLNGIDQHQFSFTSHDDLYIVDENRTLKKHSLSNFGNRPNVAKGGTLFHRVKYDPIEKQYWFINELQELTVFHPEKGILFKPLDRFKAIAQNDLNDIFIDNNGTVWFGTFKGLHKFKYASNSFKKYLYADSPEGNKKRFNCRKITSNDQGDLYVNTVQGLFRIKNSDSTNKEERNNIQKIRNGGFSLLANKIDSKSNLWISVLDSIYRYQNNKIDKTWANIPSHVWSMYEGANKFWLGSRQGRKTKDQLCYIDLTTDELHIFNSYNGFERLRKSIIYAIQKTSDGTLWLVTNEGLFILNEINGIQAQYSTQGEGKFYFPVDELKHFHEDKAGIIWLATSQGLLRWDRQQHTFQQFTDKDGLSHNNLHAVYEDDFGFLWMSSDYGLNQFQKSTGKLKSYLSSDGITHHEFNRIAHHQVTKSNVPEQMGMIYFGGLNGITAFRPRDFVERFDRQPDIPIVLLKTEIFRKKTNAIEDLRQDLEEGKHIVINPGDQSLYLEFALLDYRNPKKISYEYSINGVKENWASRKGNSLLISGLPYGNHEISIYAKTGNGAYSKQELRIPIHVLRPFYLQLWFAFLSVGILGAIIFGAYKRRTNKLIEQRNILEAEVKIRIETIEKQAKELRHIDKIKSRFFANVSHELRTPLTLILSPLNAVLKRNEIKKEDAKLIATANHNAKNLLKLTNEILDLTKLEVSKMELIENPVSILEESRRIFSSFDTQAFQQGIQFHFINEVNPKLQIQLDLNKFEKVINNLLSNALKFTTKKGKVIFKLKQSDQKIKIEIQDSGKGISPTDLPHIFERFYQSKEKNAPTEGGTGIGLALCLEFAKLFKGQISVESELGKGSTFYFEIPKKEIKIEEDIIGKFEDDTHISNYDAIPELIANINSDIMGKEKSAETPATILVVEDNVDLRNFLKMILQNKYKILCAENGEEAWQLLQENKNIDLVLSDLMMPVMDGFQLLKKIKSNTSFASIPVVMLTARAELQDRLKALRIGVDDYILKPFQEEELLTRIQNLLKNSTLRKVYQKETVVEVAGIEIEEETSFELTNDDRDWLAQLEEKVLTHISSFAFNAEALAKTLFLSRRQLDRRLKVLTGLTTGEYIREARLQEARRLVETRNFQSIKEICFEVGIKSPSYFSKMYKKRFGETAMELFKKS